MESPSMTYCNVLLTPLGVLSPEQAQNLLDRCRNWGDGLTRFLNEFRNCSGGGSVLSRKMSSFSRVNFLPTVLFKLLVITVTSVHKVALSRTGAHLRTKLIYLFIPWHKHSPKKPLETEVFPIKQNFQQFPKHLDTISILILLPLSKIQF